MSKKCNLAGMRFGMLTAEEPTNERKNGYIVWICRCDCGNRVHASSRSLKKGWATSCGCMTEEPYYEDLTGQRFGKLRVLSKAEGHDKQDRILWNCVCDCGKEITAPGRELRNGYRRSCGCRSKLYKSKHFVDGTCVELIRSRTIAKNNTSGVRGVYKSGNRKKWCAQITFQGKTRYLGSFNTLEEAAEARSRGENLFNEFLARYDAENPSKQKNASAPGIG